MGSHAERFVLSIMGQWEGVEEIKFAPRGLDFTHADELPSPVFLGTGARRCGVGSRGK